jgi:glycerophosphoryl diester phosphodiesterase
MPASPTVIAHRGIHTGALTENTMPAYAAAAAAGAEMIELDVRHSGADELAILHDDGRGGVTLADVSVAELEQRTGLRTPLLSDVLDWADGRMPLDIELKEATRIDRIAELLTAFAGHGNELLVTSFLEDALVQLHRRAPLLRQGLLFEESSTGAVERALALGAEVVLPPVELADRRLLETARVASLAVWVWDFLPARDGALLADPAVAAVITDDVPGTLAARAALPQR